MEGRYTTHFTHFSMTTALHGIEISAALTVRDVHASLAWYRDVFGFAVAREFVRDDRLMGVSLRAGAVKVLIMQDDGAKGLDREKGEGFSCQITTNQNIDDFANAIVARGAVLTTQPADIMGARAFRLRDPDGFRWTISSVRAEPRG